MKLLTNIAEWHANFKSNLNHEAAQGFDFLKNPSGWWEVE